MTAAAGREVTPARMRDLAAQAEALAVTLQGAAAQAKRMGRRG